MLIKLEKVKKQYKDFQLDCSLELQEGRITGLIGQNGAGKTTTFKAILNLIKISDGKITVFDKDSTALTSSDRASIGAVLSGSGFSEVLCASNVMKIMKAAYPNFKGQFFMDKCRHFRLPMDKPIKEYSTGMRAKLKLLIAMSHNAKLLILDEPTSGMDVIVRDEILDLLRGYMEEDSSRGIIISSHISADLETLCDDIYMIHEGKVILHEDTDAILGDYGIIKAEDKVFSKLDRTYLLRVKKEQFGYTCLTNNKQYYINKYPELVIEKGSIDGVITMLIKGETLWKA